MDTELVFKLIKSKVCKSMTDARNIVRYVGGSEEKVDKIIEEDKRKTKIKSKYRDRAYEWRGPSLDFTARKNGGYCRSSMFPVLDWYEQ